MTEDNNLEPKMKDQKDTAENNKTIEIELKAVADGEIVPIEEVDDQLFSQKIIGDGYGIIPTGNKIYSPINGKVETIAITNHAVYLSTLDNIKILIHIGIDTIALKGENFSSKIVRDTEVEIGDVLVNFDPKYIIAEGYNPIVSVVILDTTHGNTDIEVFPTKEAIANQTVALKASIYR